MNQEKLRLITRNLESLVALLKEEINDVEVPEPDNHINYDDRLSRLMPPLEDFDEVYSDEG